MRRVAFDWDGTLVGHARKPDFEDASAIIRSTRPYPDGLRRARTLMDNGTDLHVVTGRGDHLRAVTLAQVRLFLRSDFPRENLHNSPFWRGYGHLRSYKAERLNEIQPEVFVGDHESDQLAAVDAGVPFMQAENFRAGFPMPGGPWMREPLVGAI